jgi:hypothetical protein
VLTIIANRMSTASTVPMVVVTERSFTEDVYGANSITFRWVTKTVGGNISGPNTVATLLPGVTTFGATPPNSSGVPYPIGVYGGDANLPSGVTSYPPIDYDNCANSSAQNNQALPNSNTLQIPGSNGTSQPGANVTQSPNNGPSQTHIAAIFTAYNETVSYEIDNHLVVFYPKVQGAAPVVQQTANPSLRVIQAGYSRRYVPVGADSTLYPTPAPLAVLPGSNPLILVNSIQPETPQPVGDGSTNLCGVHWRYVYEVTNPNFFDTTDDLPLTFPVDPRRQSSLPIDFPTQTQANTFPDLLVVNGASA